MTQPYDKISPAMQDRYYAASPYNLVRIILGKAQEPATTSRTMSTRAPRPGCGSGRAKACCCAMPSPASTFMCSVHEFPATRRAAKIERRGFIALGRVEDYDRKSGLPA